MIRSLDEAVGAGEPLIDIVVRFKEGVDYAFATDMVNALGPDMQLNKHDWYGDPRLRIGQVTAEGALRHFGVRFQRVHLEKWDEKAKRYDGVHQEYFRWSRIDIVQWPESLAPFVEAVGVTQPGANDDCQAYTPLFDR
jgi:hypothetical protein